MVADRYGDFAVVKLYSAGLTPHRAHIVEALRQEARGWPASSAGTRSPRDEESDEAAPQGRVLWGAEPPERIEIDEHGMKLLVDVRSGQKTGFFLDQRENRRHGARASRRGAATRSTSSATPAASRWPRPWAARGTW